MQNIAYLLALHNIDGLGSIRLKALLDYYQDPKLVWEANPKELLEIRLPKTVIERLKWARQNLDPEKYMQSIIDSGIKWLTIFDEKYPRLLKQIPDAPVVFYYLGDIEPLDEKSVAVVGSRRMTSYGKHVTNNFTKEFIMGGLTVVSGLARGVDTEAHKTTVVQQGRTIAVLGGGIKNIFPPENRGLVQKIISGYGAVISEFPPEYPPLPGNFPARNRIISGLSLAVVVTEAAIDSGSLITARLAADQGREVYVVPGPVTSNLSHGPISLIKEGAKAVYTADEILEDLGARIRRKPVDILIDLSSDERRVWALLENESRHIDEIGRELQWPSAKTAGVLIKMEIFGLISNLGNGIFCRI